MQPKTPKKGVIAGSIILLFSTVLPYAQMTVGRDVSVGYGIRFYTITIIVPVIVLISIFIFSTDMVQGKVSNLIQSGINFLLGTYALLVINRALRTMRRPAKEGVLFGEVDSSPKIGIYVGLLGALLITVGALGTVWASFDWFSSSSASEEGNPGNS